MIAIALQEEQDREMARKVAAEEEEQQQAQLPGQGVVPAVAPIQDMSALNRAAEQVPTTLLQPQLLQGAKYE